MISVTMLSGYLYCARKLYLERVLKLFEPPKEALVLGSIRHEAHDNINKAEEKLVKETTKKTNFDELLERYKKAHSEILRNAIKKYREELSAFNLAQPDVFKRTWPLIIKESEKRARNVFDFMEKTGFFGEELWENLTPKIISEFRVNSEALGLKGIIDQIEDYGDVMVPIELKTGKSPASGAWPGHRVQLLAYLMLLSEASGGEKEINEGRIIYLDSDKTVPVSLNPFAEKEVKELVSNVKSLLGSDKIPSFCGSENKCNICGLKGDCYDENKLGERLKSLSKPHE